jgi:hypothetical protein
MMHREKTGLIMGLDVIRACIVTEFKRVENSVAYTIANINPDYLVFVASTDSNDMIDAIVSKTQRECTRLFVNRGNVEDARNAAKIACYFLREKGVKKENIISNFHYCTPWMAIGIVLGVAEHDANITFLYSNQTIRTMNV